VFLRSNNEPLKYVITEYL